MLPYIILLLVILLILSFSRNIIQYNLNVKYLFLVALILILFATLRSNNVGTDANNYIYMFNNLAFNQNNVLNEESSTEIGYLIIQRIAYLISTNYWSLFFIVSFLSVSISLLALYKTSENIMLSIFLYVALGHYLFLFNGARQAIAIAVCYLGFYFLIQKKFKSFFISFCLAFIFHKSSVFFLPFYFLNKLKFSFRNLFFISLITLIVSFLAFNILPLFGQLFSDGYLQYQNRGAKGGYYLALYYTITSLILIIIRRNIPKPKLSNYDIYLFMCWVTTIIYLFVVFTGTDINFLRLTFFLSTGNILIWPIVFSSIKFFRIRLIRFLFYSVHFIYFLIYLQRMSNLVPYTVNYSIF